MQVVTKRGGEGWDEGYTFHSIPLHGLPCILVVCMV